jgi:hypothetical protein
MAWNCINEKSKILLKEISSKLKKNGYVSWNKNFSDFYCNYLGIYKIQHCNKLKRTFFDIETIMYQEDYERYHLSDCLWKPAASY